MIDIHCHIVPNIDDGAKSLDDALEMAKVAYDEGIRKIDLRLLIRELFFSHM